MMTCYDLHCHSTASDGSLTPTALVERARQMGVDVLALTDHDATHGLAEAGVAARGQGLDLIAGLEVSVTWAGQTVHIVGLFIDPANAELQTGLERLQAFRRWRAREIALRLEKKRIPGAYEGAQAFCGGQIMSRTHFAQFLVQAGYAPDIRSVFKKYLVRGRPGYVPGNWAGLEEALNWIHQAGGVAVIAHPARYPMSATKLRELFKEFKEFGGLAIEVVSGSHSRDNILHMSDMARRFDLHASSGSDFHAPSNAYTELGRLTAVPEANTPIWQSDAWQARASRAGIRP
ncbi:MAG: PHP domain-containing protein [Gammaproteobacteria bacterium]